MALKESPKLEFRNPNQIPRLKLETGFTLIELVVVISVIAILMALLFPAFRGVQDQAKKTQAKNDLTQIVTAVNAYYAEYGKMPLADNRQGLDTLAGDPNGTYDNRVIFDILRAISDGDWNQNDALNPKKIIFFGGNTAKDATHPKNGFAPQDTTGSNGVPIKQNAFVDPWGNEYLVAVDGTYDGWTADYVAYTDLSYTMKDSGSGDRNSVQGTAIASSWGKDGKHGRSGDDKYKESDDVISWQ